ncbi:Uncharacterized protein AC501_3609 [Pseudomonas amygdali pv. lachrymans]|nr:Uncharacterized protein AC501_3609 [Pseudomonas amygdali pv. lachrymans]
MGSSRLIHPFPFPSEDTDRLELADANSATFIPTLRAWPGQYRLDVRPLGLEDLKGVVIAIKQNKHHYVKRLLEVDRSKPTPTHA